MRKVADYKSDKKTVVAVVGDERVKETTMVPQTTYHYLGRIETRSTETGNVIWWDEYRDSNKDALIKRLQQEARIQMGEESSEPPPINDKWGMPPFIKLGDES